MNIILQEFTYSFCVNPPRALWLGINHSPTHSFALVASLWRNSLASDEPWAGIGNIKEPLDGHPPSTYCPTFKHQWYSKPPTLVSWSVLLNKHIRFLHSPLFFKIHRCTHTHTILLMPTFSDGYEGMQADILNNPLSVWMTEWRIYLSLLLSKSEILNQRNDLITNLIISDSSRCSHEWRMVWHWRDGWMGGGGGGCAFLTQLPMTTTMRRLRVRVGTRK